VGSCHQTGKQTSTKSVMKYSHICENHFIADDYNTLTYEGKGT